jgi:hypothetical protein
VVVGTLLCERKFGVLLQYQLAVRIELEVVVRIELEDAMRIELEVAMGIELEALNLEWMDVDCQWRVDPRILKRTMVDCSQFLV